MTSCATIRPHKYVTIHTTEQSKIIHKEDTVHTDNNKMHLRVEKREPLSIVVITDSLTEFIDIKSRIFSYPHKIFINSSDATSQYRLFGKANNKGELYLHYSFSFLHPFLMAVEGKNGKRQAVGFGGAFIGLDYYYHKNQFVSFEYSSLMDANTRKKNIQNGYEREEMESEHFSISNNHKFERFSIGYGFSFAKNFWDHKRYRKGWLFPNTYWGSSIENKNHTAFGLIFPASFQVGEYFHIGIVYRPTFYRPNISPNFAYEHIISFNFGWKIRLKK